MLHLIISLKCLSSHTHWLICGQNVFSCLCSNFLFPMNSPQFLYHLHRSSFFVQVLLCRYSANAGFCVQAVRLSVEYLAAEVSGGVSVKHRLSNFSRESKRLRVGFLGTQSFAHPNSNMFRSGIIIVLCFWHCWNLHELHFQFIRVQNHMRKVKEFTRSRVWLCQLI